MDEKGFLHLSIKTIVVVIIVLAFLGLGLLFVKSQIGDIDKTPSEIKESLQDDMYDDFDLRSENRKLSFNATKLTLGTGEESVQVVTLKNTQENIINIILGFEVKANNGFIPFTSGQEMNFTSGIKMDFTTELYPVTSTIIWDDTVQTLKPGESRVIHFTVTAPDKTGNYLYKIVVNKQAANGTIEVYDSQTFFIITS